jgi:hypothetical protein
MDDKDFSPLLGYGKDIRIGTMCSGTECPIIAMELLQKRKNYMFREMIDLTHLVLAKQSKKLQHKHRFYAEIVPFKQAYVQIN